MFQAWCRLIGWNIQDLSQPASNGNGSCKNSYKTSSPRRAAYQCPLLIINRHFEKNELMNIYDAQSCIANWVQWQAFVACALAIFAEIALREMSPMNRAAGDISDAHYQWCSYFNALRSCSCIYRYMNILVQCPGSRFVLFLAGRHLPSHMLNMLADHACKPLCFISTHRVLPCAQRLWKPSLRTRPCIQPCSASNILGQVEYGCSRELSSPSGSIMCNVSLSIETWLV